MGIRRAVFVIAAFGALELALLSGCGGGNNSNTLSPSNTPAASATARPSPSKSPSIASPSPIASSATQSPTAEPTLAPTPTYANQVDPSKLEQMDFTSLTYCGNDYSSSIITDSASRIVISNLPTGTEIIFPFGWKGTLDSQLHQDDGDAAIYRQIDGNGRLDILSAPGQLIFPAQVERGTIIGTANGGYITIPGFPVSNAQLLLTYLPDVSNGNAITPNDSGCLIPP